jgi:hypothetical protein
VSGNLGRTFVGDWPDIVSWMGIVLIAGSGLYIVYSETVQGRKKIFTNLYLENVKTNKTI